MLSTKMERVRQLKKTVHLPEELLDVYLNQQEKAHTALWNIANKVIFI